MDILKEESESEGFGGEGPSNPADLYRLCVVLYLRDTYASIFPFHKDKLLGGFIVGP